MKKKTYPNLEIQQKQCVEGNWVLWTLTLERNKDTKYLSFHLKKEEGLVKPKLKDWCWNQWIWKQKTKRENQWNQNSFFEKSTKIGKDTQAKNWQRQKRETIQINKVRNEWGGISNSLTEI